MSDMARTLRRRPLLSRLFTTYLTLVVVVMFTGIVGAVPVSFAEEGNPEAIESVMAPEESEESSGAVAPADEPLEGDDVPGGVEPAAEEEIEAPEASALMMAPAAAEISPMLAAPGTGIKVNFFQGYNRYSGWTTGNLGKNYEEGDSVPYRLILQNTGTEEASPLDLIFGLDHFNDGKNAVMFEETSGWGYKIYDAMPDSDDPDTPPAGLVPLAPMPQDAGVQGVSPVIESTIPVGSFTIPAGKYAIVYFQAELAMTLKWMPLQGSYGAGGYPGSSGQGYLLMGGGKKTVPLPSVVVPGGDISVFKFYDTDQDGAKDANETQFLAGWEIHLADGEPIDSVTTDANGKAFFDYLPAGTYYVSETLKDGWLSNTPQPIEVVVGKGESKIVYIGNFELLPEIELTKSGTFEDENADGIAQAGETISYTFKVENTGNVTLYDVMVTDPLVTVVGGPLASLAVGAYDDTTFTASYVLTQDDIDAGEVYNEALVTGYGPGEAPVTDTDDETVLLGQRAAIELIKSGTWVDSNADGFADVGEPVNYTFTVANTGNVTLYNVTVTDPLLTVVGGPLFSLAVGGTDSTTFTGVYYLTQADIDAGEVYNEALVTGYGPDQEPVTDTDDETVYLPQNPAIEIVKLTNGADGEYIPVGAAITWSYQVTNTGNVTLTDIEVTDDIEGLIGTIDVLAPGASETLEHEGVAEEGLYENIGTAVGNPPTGEDVVDDDDDSSYFGSSPAIDVVKSVSSSLVLAGDEVTYTFVVTNTGNVPLYDVVVEDDRLGMIAEIDELAVGESLMFTKTAVITEPTTNVVVATGTPPVGEPVSDTDDAFVDIDEFLGFPDLGVEKSADRTKADPGDTITYTVVITNYGSADASNYVVVDTFDQRYLAVTDAAGGVVSNGKITWNIAGPLAAGASQTITYKMLVSENMPAGTTYLDNVVVVTHPDDDNPDNDRSTWRVSVEEEPFLPFTGADILGLLALAGAAAATGTALRRRSRKAA